MKDEKIEPIEEEFTNIEELMKEEGIHPHPEIRKVSEESDFKDKYFRQLAETENMRKRLQEEKQQTISFAIDRVIAEFLTPLDQFEKALEFAKVGSDEVKSWSTGFQMILGQFQQVLSEYDVKPFESVGTPFDPHKHEAIEMVETSEQEDGTVIAEIVKGYEKNGRIVRHARVKVAVKPTNEGETHE